jgi:hypothetical protein
MREAGGTEHGELQACVTLRRACPTGGSHTRTTRGPAQRGEGAKHRPRQGAFKKRGRGHYKGRSPAESRPGVLEEPQ